MCNDVMLRRQLEMEAKNNKILCLDCHDVFYCFVFICLEKQYLLLKFEFSDPLNQSSIAIFPPAIIKIISLEMNCIRTMSKKQLRKPIFSLLSSWKMTFVWTRPTPEPFRQRVVRWGCYMFLCVCCSAVALFAYNCTSIWSNWLLWPCPGVLRKSHSKLCPSAHFTAHRPYHWWVVACAN